VRMKLDKMESPGPKRPSASRAIEAWAERLSATRAVDNTDALWASSRLGCGCATVQRVGTAKLSLQELGERRLATLALQTCAGVYENVAALRTVHLCLLTLHRSGLRRPCVHVRGDEPGASIPDASGEGTKGTKAPLQSTRVTALMAGTNFEDRSASRLLHARWTAEQVGANRAALG
jgi:hypothetical protein